MRKQIPNLFTLANLFLGCIAIIYTLQPGLTLTVNSFGENLVSMPEKMMWAGWLIFAAAIIDFFDGFVARFLKVTSELGKQLDSLSDIVSFGVAPSLIVYQFLRYSYSQDPGGLDISFTLLLPALLIPCAGAYRLARFNIDNSQQYAFKGVPIPAVGILFASFPILSWYNQTTWIAELLLNKWFWYGLICITSYLMIASWPMLAIKFNGLTFKKLLPFILISIIAIVAALLYGWLAVLISFFAYVIISLIFKQVNNDI